MRKQSPSTNFSSEKYLASKYPHFHFQKYRILNYDWPSNHVLYLPGGSDTNRGILLSPINYVLLSCIFARLQCWLVGLKRHVLCQLSNDRATWHCTYKLSNCPLQGRILYFANKITWKKHEKNRSFCHVAGRYWTQNICEPELPHSKRGRDDEKGKGEQDA
jgi:hypothetical protein